MTIRYVFRDGVLPFPNIDDVDPQMVGESIARARKRVLRKLEAGEDLDREDSVPRILLADVKRNKDHPIAPLLSKGTPRELADKLHLHEIRQVVNTIRIVNDSTGEPMRGFISIRASVNQPRQYVRTDEIITNTSMQIATLKAAERDLLAFWSRYRHLLALCPDLAPLADLPGRLADVRRAMETRGFRPYPKGSEGPEPQPSV